MSHSSECLCFKWFPYVRKDKTTSCQDWTTYLTTRHQVPIIDFFGCAGYISFTHHTLQSIILPLRESYSDQNVVFAITTEDNLPIFIFDHHKDLGANSDRIARKVMILRVEEEEILPSFETLSLA